MLHDTIDHQTLRELALADAIKSTIVEGRPGGWALIVSNGKSDRVLTAQRSGKARLFRHMETLVSYLRDIGIERFDVYAENFVLEAKSAGRPDRSAALRKLHEAAEHDRWFRAEVEKSLAEANDPDTQWVPQKTIQADIEEMRRDIRERSKGLST